MSYTIFVSSIFVYLLTVLFVVSLSFVLRYWETGDRWICVKHTFENVSYTTHGPNSCLYWKLNEYSDSLFPILQLMYLVKAHKNGTELCLSLLIYWIEIYEIYEIRKSYLPTSIKELIKLTFLYHSELKKICVQKVIPKFLVAPFLEKVCDMDDIH